jgi:putative transposase
MDGKGRYIDNLFIERLWRSLKYEEVYLKAYAGGKEARAGIGEYFDFYNLERPHQALGYQTPAEVFIKGKKTATLADLVESRKPSQLAEPTEAVGPALNSAFLLSN